MATQSNNSLHSQPEGFKSVHAVPSIPKFKPSTTNKAFYCFPAGTSEADKQHDIEQVNLFIESIKAKRKLTGGE